MLILQQVQVVKDKQSGDVFAMKTLKKSQTLAQESVSIKYPKLTLFSWHWTSLQFQTDNR